MTSPADVANFAVNPDEAIGFFRQKVNLPTETWTDLWQDMHARAFVVAGATKEELISDFRNAVDQALAEGKSLGWFRQEFDQIVKRHGWSYRGTPGWRSAIILNTNLRMSYATGKWAQFKRLASRRPFLRYVAVMDSRTRPMHRAWHNVILPFEHPWWRTHFPPNGWNCRCMVQQLSERDVKRLGLRVWDDAPFEPDVYRSIRTPQGLVQIKVPKGIDAGFAYNPGEAAFGAGADALALVRHGSFAPLTGYGRSPATGPLPVDQPKAGVLPQALEAGDEAGIYRVLNEALGGDELALEDPAGATVTLSRAIADHWLADRSRQDGRERYYPLLPEIVSDPAEIWLGFAKSSDDGRVALRRRYIKLVQLRSGVVIGLVADADGHRWSGVTFFRSNSLRASKMLRQGLLVWKRKG